MSNQVATKTTGALAKINFAEDANIGLEKMTAQDLAIPFLALIQKTSPQIEEIDGCKPGMIFNTVSGKVYKELIVLPCGYKRSFVEWTPREKGGGYVGEHQPGDKITLNPRNERGEIVLENGNILVETAYQFVLALDGNHTETAVISMSSTQLKKARRWNSMMMGLKVPHPNGTMVTPASFSHMYKISSVQEKNDKGSWHGWNIEIMGPVKDTNQYQMAKTFAGGVKNNDVKVAPPKQDDAPKPKQDF